ncbi:hypothetical protein HD806DRAFT_452920 [Xylariaceae sp. AK1471]|nr:hypothetical protein HD806DRAFT_452920 [Xylariaceae sp. AK1471]
MMSCKKPVHMAKGAVTRLPVRYSAAIMSTTTAKGEQKKQNATFSKFRRISPVFNRFSTELVRNTHPRLSSPQEVSASTANLKLARTLETGRRLYENIAGGLTRRIKFPHTTSHSLENLENLEKWELNVEDHTHRLMASQRHYLELCATQLLLSVIWSIPDIPNREGLALNVLNFMNSSKKNDLGWTGVRKLLIQHIGIARRYMPHYISFYQLKTATQHPPKRQLEPNHRASRPESPQAHLDRALVLVLTADRLYLAMRLRGTYRNLMRLVDEMVRIIRQLELIDERIWLSSHLENSHEYVSEMEAELSRIVGQVENEETPLAHSHGLADGHDSPASDAALAETVIG